MPLIVNSLKIGQYHDNYLIANYTEDSYRKIFTDALRDYLDMGQHKYVIYTNKIYQAVFCERAQEYKKVLDLFKKDKIRGTLYTEVLNAIGSFENGLAVQLKQQCEQLGRKLTSKELDEPIKQAEESPFLKPFMLDARIKMASRDLAFREALHYKLQQSTIAQNSELQARYASSETAKNNIEIANVARHPSIRAVN